MERVPLVVVENESIASNIVALRICELIREKRAKGKIPVLGLATGRSPLCVYDKLIALHREGKISFADVVTFNLDEYLGLQPSDPLSYQDYMHQNLFKHIDIKPENAHVPPGILADSEITAACAAYEALIRSYGGLDFQLLGIGRTGHIGFNEPGSPETSRTRAVTLDPLTRLDARREFKQLEKVPRRAITMGIKTILEAAEVVMLAWGEPKAEILKAFVEGELTERVPATFLQKCDNLKVYVDAEATTQLTRSTAPWLISDVDWSSASLSLKKKAVIWLSQKMKLPILKLTDQHYLTNGLDGLLQTEADGAYSININIFRAMQYTITGWPGGHAEKDDSTRPERALPATKRVIVFSPHPDDDVISMGGTLHRLIRQKHDVTVVYQTSGANAVSNEVVERFASVSSECGNSSSAAAVLSDLAAETETAATWSWKASIRRAEARAALKALAAKEGPPKSRFLNLPFYDTGKTRKRPLSRDDVNLVKDLIREIKPHQIFAAGDLADPHGTHRVCLEAIAAALDELKCEDWSRDCWVWLYRGAWMEYPLHEIEMAVPMSPDEVDAKRTSILKHESQLAANAMYLGDDQRDFWRRAEERNALTAEAYNRLGLAEYAAIEAFVRYKFHSEQLFPSLRIAEPHQERSPLYIAPM